MCGVVLCCVVLCRAVSVLWCGVRVLRGPSSLRRYPMSPSPRASLLLLMKLTGLCRFFLCRGSPGPRRNAHAEVVTLTPHRRGMPQRRPVLIFARLAPKQSEAKRDTCDTSVGSAAPANSLPGHITEFRRTRSAVRIVACN